MTRDEFDYEISRVELAYKGERYSAEQEDLLYSDVKALSLSSWKEICDRVRRKYHKLPALAAYLDMRSEMHSTLLYAGGDTVSCGRCDKGFLYAHFETDDGDKALVSRCNCATGNALSKRIKTIPDTMKAKGFVEWITPQDVMKM